MSAVVSALCWWLVLGSMFAGLGLLVRRQFGLRCDSAEAVFSCFWVGWAASVAFLQLWHLAWRVDGRALAVLALTGVAGLVASRTDLRSPDLRKPAPTTLLTAGFCLGLGLWVASRAIGPLSAGDTGLYGWPMVKWLTSHPIVAGLGNLHGRLAYNSSFHLYAAVTDAGPWHERPHALANGTLMFVLLAQAVHGSVTLFSKGRAAPAHRLFFALLSGPILAAIAQPGPKLPSLTTDLPTFALALVIASQMLLLLTSRRERDFRMFSITVLCAAGIVVKASLAGFAATAFLISWIYWWKRGKSILLMFAGGFAVLAPWLARNVMLSGYLVYPGGFGAFDVEWRVPRSLALEEAYFIAGWARRAGVHWSRVIDGWDWLPFWLAARPATFWRLVLLAAAALAYAAWRARGRPRAPWWILAPAAVSLIFCALTAPNPRFVAAALPTLAAGAVALALPEDARPRQAAWLVFLLFIAVPALLAPYRIPDRYRGASYYSVPTAAHEVKVTHSGLAVHVPKEDEFCWDAPLPCAPYFRPNLRTLVEGDLGSGFVLDDSFTFADMHVNVPQGFSVSPDLGVATISGWRISEGGRAVVDRGKLLIYTEEEKTARLRFRARSLRVGTQTAARGTLRILVNGSPVFEGPVEPPVEIAAVLDFGRDFNDVVLEIDVAGEPARGEGIRFVRLDLEEFELMSE